MTTTCSQQRGAWNESIDFISFVYRTRARHWRTAMVVMRIGLGAKPRGMDDQGHDATRCGGRREKVNTESVRKRGGVGAVSRFGEESVESRP